jgi:hypothetical protein
MTESRTDKLRNTPFALAMALLVPLLGVAATQVEALKDYFYFLAEYTNRDIGARLIFQFLLVVLLYLLFASLYFNLVFRSPLRLSVNAKIILWIDLFARLVITLTPTILLMYLFFTAASEIGNWVTWLAVCVLIMSTSIQIMVALARYPFRSAKLETFFARIELQVVPLVYWLSLSLMPAAIATVILLYTWLWLDVLGAASYIGGLGVIFLFLVFLLIGQRIIVANKKRLRSISGWLILLFVINIGAHLGTAPPNFRHQISQVPPVATTAPYLSQAFKQWVLEKPGFQQAVAAKKQYPIFIVAAQGGGQYAAYHSALFLARLYDRCPRLKDHVFAVSAVSGGSLGAAVFAELLRTSDIANTCEVKRDGEGPLERSVRRFFSYDFVTPVLASGLFFDIPAFLIPQLRIRPDRAATLELAFEQAWQRTVQLEGQVGLARNFYGRWSASGPAPALLLNATSSNYGLPIVISELDMIPGGPVNLRTLLLKNYAYQFDVLPGDAGKALRRALIESTVSSEYTRPKYFTILGYAPDLQMNLSTAVTLSARFPYVTPPGVLSRNREGAFYDATLNETGAIQLIDGGFSDNSGIATAIEIVQQLQESDFTKELVKDIAFHLISFGHSKLAFNGTGTRDAQSELLAPLATFEAVRQSRRLQPRDALSAGFKRVHAVELFDHAFQAPLTWTLSERVRKQIEFRSGGETEPTLCCSLNLPPLFAALDIDLVLDLGPQGIELLNLGVVKRIAPNKDRFDDIIHVVIDSKIRPSGN